MSTSHETPCMFDFCDYCVLVAHLVSKLIRKFVYRIIKTKTVLYKYLTVGSNCRLWAEITIIIIIGCTHLGGHWPPQANVSIGLYPGHPQANFYIPVCSVSLAADICVLFHVVVEVSVQLHFTEVQQRYFLWVGFFSLTPNPQIGGPGYPFFVWVITLDLFGMGGSATS